MKISIIKKKKFYLEKIFLRTIILFFCFKNKQEQKLMSQVYIDNIYCLHRQLKDEFHSYKLPKIKT